MSNKNEICKKFVKFGECMYGDKCSFKHDMSSIEKSPNKSGKIQLSKETLKFKAIKTNKTTAKPSPSKDLKLPSSIVVVVNKPQTNESDLKVASKILKNAPKGNERSDNNRKESTSRDFHDYSSKDVKYDSREDYYATNSYHNRDSFNRSPHGGCYAPLQRYHPNEDATSSYNNRYDKSYSPPNISSSGYYPNVMPPEGGRRMRGAPVPDFYDNNDAASPLLLSSSRDNSCSAVAAPPSAYRYNNNNNRPMSDEYSSSLIIRQQPGFNLSPRLSAADWRGTSSSKSTPRYDYNNGEYLEWNSTPTLQQQGGIGGGYNKRRSSASPPGEDPMKLRESGTGRRYYSYKKKYFVRNKNNFVANNRSNNNNNNRNKWKNTRGGGGVGGSEALHTARYYLSKYQKSGGNYQNFRKNFKPVIRIPRFGSSGYVKRNNNTRQQQFNNVNWKTKNGSQNLNKKQFTSRSTSTSTTINVKSSSGTSIKKNNAVPSTINMNNKNSSDNDNNKKGKEAITKIKLVNKNGCHRSSAFSKLTPKKRLSSSSTTTITTSPKISSAILSSTFSPKNKSSLLQQPKISVLRDPGAASILLDIKSACTTSSPVESSNISISSTEQTNNLLIKTLPIPSLKSKNLQEIKLLAKPSSSNSASTSPVAIVNNKSKIPNIDSLKKVFMQKFDKIINEAAAAAKREVGDGKVKSPKLILPILEVPSKGPTSSSDIQNGAPPSKDVPVSGNAPKLSVDEENSLEDLERKRQILLLELQNEQVPEDGDRDVKKVIATTNSILPNNFKRTFKEVKPKDTGKQTNNPELLDDKKEEISNKIQTPLPESSENKSSSAIIEVSSKISSSPALNTKAAIELNPLKSPTKKKGKPKELFSCDDFSSLSEDSSLELPPQTINNTSFEDETLGRRHHHHQTKKNNWKSSKNMKNNSINPRSIAESFYNKDLKSSSSSSSSSSSHRSDSVREIVVKHARSFEKNPRKSSVKRPNLRNAVKTIKKSSTSGSSSTTNSQSTSAESSPHIFKKEKLGKSSEIEEGECLSTSSSTEASCSSASNNSSSNSSNNGGTSNSSKSSIHRHPRIIKKSSSSAVASSNHSFTSQPLPLPQLSHTAAAVTCVTGQEERIVTSRSTISKSEIDAVNNNNNKKKKEKEEDESSNEADIIFDSRKRRPKKDEFPSPRPSCSNIITANKNLLTNNDSHKLSITTTTTHEQESSVIKTASAVTTSTSPKDSLAENGLNPNYDNLPDVVSDQTTSEKTNATTEHRFLSVAELNKLIHPDYFGTKRHEENIKNSMDPNFEFDCPFQALLIDDVPEIETPKRETPPALKILKACGVSKQIIGEERYKLIEKMIHYNTLTLTPEQKDETEHHPYFKHPIALLHSYYNSNLTVDDICFDHDLHTGQIDNPLINDETDPVKFLEKIKVAAMPSDVLDRLKALINAQNNA